MLGLKDRFLSLVPGHEATGTDRDATEPQDDFSLHVLYDGTKAEAESLAAQVKGGDEACLEPVKYVTI